MSEDSATFAERALAAMLDLLDEGALVFEGDRLVCLTASERAAVILGIEHAAAIGRPRADLLADVVARDEASRGALETLRGATASDVRHATLVIGAEPPRTVEWVTAPIVVGGRPAGRVDVLIERTAEQKLRDALDRANARIAETTLFDELTTLANRKHFTSEIDREHRRSQRAWAPYAVARIDVDGMAAINRDLGKDTGDALLRRVGEELRTQRREYDLVARWEEDEIIVLLPGMDEQSVKGVLTRSVAAMRDAARARVAREVTFCVGVALWVPPSQETADDIVKRAGLALEAAKLMGAGNMEIDVTTVEWKDDPDA